METAPPSAQPTEEERLWAMLAHVLTFVSAFIAPLVIYFVYRERSKFVAFHAMQSLLFHLGLWVIAFALIVMVITVVLACVAIPLSWIVTIGALVYVIVIAIRAHQGQLAEYVLVGPMAKSIVGL